QAMANRLGFYQPGESMEEILCQAGNVGIYEGDMKQTQFEQGTVSMTLHRVIWADSSNADCRLTLHHSLVKHIDKHHKTIFSRGGKISVALEQPPSNLLGPISASIHNHVRFVFKGGGEDEFYRRYEEALKRKIWQRNSSGSSSSGSRASHATNQRSVGIAGIERKLAENHIRTHESISQAFEDMSRLMESAKEMVTLSKSIAEKMKARQGEISQDETVSFKSYLLSLGVSDPVTKSTYGGGSLYFEKLAEELSSVLAPALKECGGVMTLPEAFCRINRARGMELLSPEDVLNACSALEKIKGPVEMARFPSGVIVVQLREASVESSIGDTVSTVEGSGSLTAAQLSSVKGITVVLAKERLLAAESAGKLCRDDTLEGLSFFTNKFIESS
ncbi:hypothetical protein PENTCL1PPCAC_11293, partial [Pristionchus entomophagus]